MLGQLHASKATNSYDRKLRSLIQADLLIIDDFGLKPLQPPQDEDLHAVIAERYERRSVSGRLNSCSYPSLLLRRLYPRHVFW